MIWHYLKSTSSNDSRGGLVLQLKKPDEMSCFAICCWSSIDSGLFTEFLVINFLPEFNSEKCNFRNFEVPSWKSPGNRDVGLNIRISEWLDQRPCWEAILRNSQYPANRTKTDGIGPILLDAIGHFRYWMLNEHCPYKNLVTRYQTVLALLEATSILAIMFEHASIKWVRPDSFPASRCHCIYSLQWVEQTLLLEFRIVKRLCNLISSQFIAVIVPCNFRVKREQPGCYNCHPSRLLFVYSLFKLRIRCFWF